MPKDWEAYFPNLSGKWVETSRPTTDYNCFAFAVGDEAQWWDPLPPGLYYWPRNVPRGYSLQHFERAFGTRGFRRCDDGSLVDGIEKIAIFLNEYGSVEHAARQEPDGRWKSKIGAEEDILHDDLQALSSGDYGDPRCFMQRERNAQLRPEEAMDVSSETAKPDPPPHLLNTSHRSRMARETALLTARKQHDRRKAIPARTERQSKRAAQVQAVPGSAGQGY